MTACGCRRSHSPIQFSNSQERMRNRDLAARCARGLLKLSPKENRGRRECRVPNAPAASYAVKKAYEHSHHGHTGTTRHSPRNGFTAYFALSSVTTLFDTVACASSHRLDANDWGVGTTRLRRPRQHNSSSAPPASTASRPTLMTCATPLLSERDVRINELIWVG